MFNRILLPMDRSLLAECVLPHTVLIASAFESRITLAHVLEAPPRANWRRAVDPLNWRIRKAEAEGYLDALAGRLRNAGLTVETKILEGSAGEQIIKFSRADDIPLIILSSHGQSGFTGWNLSSIAQKILLRVHTSVMIVRAYQTPSGEPAVACVACDSLKLAALDSGDGDEVICANCGAVLELEYENICAGS
jgi:nucleotide-binding universal stress UspA family protein